jgi:hypothetical protein
MMWLAERLLASKVDLCSMMWQAERQLASKVDLCSIMIVNVVIHVVMNVKKKGKAIIVTGHGVQ